MNPIKIGNLHIHPSFVVGQFTSIGEDGFHYTRDELTQKLIEESHHFGVIIEENVRIGSHCSVDRGRWRDTVIGAGTKIDDGVHISHNCIIGKDCLIATGSTILGSVELGDGAEVWSQCVIHQGVKIGKGAVVGANTYVRHDVKDNEAVYGNDPNQVIKKRKETKKYMDRNEYFTELERKKKGGVSEIQVIEKYKIKVFGKQED